MSVLQSGWPILLITMDANVLESFLASAAGVMVAARSKIITDFVAEQVLRVLNPQLYRASRWLKRTESWQAIEGGLRSGLGFRKAVGTSLPETMTQKNFEKALAMADSSYSQIAHEEFLSREEEVMEQGFEQPTIEGLEV